MFFFSCNNIIETEDKLIKNNLHYSVFLQWQVSSYLFVLITELYSPGNEEKSNPK